mmetsp:Transcript_15813/g.23212  ORF Transcript_15813/g.23212 Transcript_15813/m.23212 type:complete len:238 (+) Transcript_15813:108-821(+)|eukprot:CAMPEP_0195530332 /NCGR_PEP_ID=MMETSP0794_2-20130614/33186_1 /TAXON_ID=515487 /ORGANISM="Stephanopyxis turris, Strain CCMP 815" /LENGTH=237 /DNA_ID=CAMNT_0040661817 /DNA_START=104 /DNA_END=817 /DNA_ORIENTATION=+
MEYSAATDCAMMISVMFGTIGLICALVSNFYCDYVTSTGDLTFTPEGGSPKDITFNFRRGIWSFMQYSTYYTTDGENLWYSTYQYCTPYPSDVPIDAKWSAAMIFGICATVFGGAIACTMCCCICGRTVSASNWRLMGFVFMLATFFQGMTFLFMSSNGCTGFTLLPEVIEGKNGTSLGTAEVSFQGCEMEWGASIGIAAAAFFFVSCVACCLAGKAVPPPDLDLAEPLIEVEGEEA